MDYTRLLLQHDDPTRWEYPPDFDYVAAAAKFAQFIAALAGELGIILKAETGSHIQDASFHSQVYLPLPGDKYVLIRFSNFGDMATGSDDEPVPEALTELVAKLLAGLCQSRFQVVRGPFTQHARDRQRSQSTARCLGPDRRRTDTGRRLSR
jgi:hypothetical protein